MTKRGGDYGGGPTITRVELTDVAARELRRRITGNYAARYTKEQANAAASQVFELLAAQRLLLITDDMQAACPWLAAARTAAPEEAQRGLDQLVAALWAASLPAV